jgi:hypothetical protein
MKHLRQAVAAVAAVGLATALAGSVAEGAPTRTGATPPADAEASFIQGLPVTSVDLWVNGAEIAQNVKYKSVIGPLPLAPGRYHLAVRLHLAKPHSKPLFEATRTLSAGENISIVADLTSTGTPNLRFYQNDEPALHTGRAALVVRNDAEDQALSVYADDLRIFQYLGNQRQNGIILPAEHVTVSMTLPNSPSVVIGPVPLNLPSQAVTVVYALGSASTGTFSDVVQTFSAS